MKIRNPIVWSAIGASLGFLAAIGGQDSRIIDGLTGAFIQAVIWYVVSWIVIRILEQNPIKKSGDKPNKDITQPNRMSLKLLFVIFYTIPLLGNISSAWKSAGTPYGLPVNFGDQLSNFSDTVFSPSGIIDIFIATSLTSALLITSAIYLYRKFASKPKYQNRKIVLTVSIVLLTIIIWFGVSIGLAILFG